MVAQRKAVALISGGLDSMLAAKVILEQGVHVEGINFYTGFCVEGHTHAIRQQDEKKPKRNNALWVAEQLGIRLNIIDVAEDYRQEVMLNPRHGYGKHLNPCIDCKVFMVSRAMHWAEAHGYDFVITGEVIGQRPMSQRKGTMPLIASESGAEDRLLRPLCAQKLPATLPEREGWVNRDALFAFHGRDRSPQIALAERYGFSDYAQPAGGCCFLTDASYTRKLRDLWKHRGKRDYELDDIVLLKVGRHIRPGPNYKLIISREEGENHFLEGYRREFVALRTLSHPGPLTLVDGDPGATDLDFAARIVARYSKGRDAEQVRVQIERGGEPERILDVLPAQPAEIPADWLL